MSVVQERSTGDAIVEVSSQLERLWTSVHDPVGVELTVGLVDALVDTAGGLLVMGWMLLADDEVVSIRWTTTSGRSGITSVLDRPDVAAAHPDHATALRSGFAVHLDSLDAATEGLELVAVGVGGSYGRIVQPLRTGVGSASKPPEHLMFRVGDTASDVVFWTTGLKVYGDFVAAMVRHGVDPGEQRILDWGCGCGRLAAFLLADSACRSYVGCDVDGEAIRWCANADPGARFDQIPLVPPTPYEESSFDVIVAYSVLTHLDRRTQQLWLGEVGRLLRPGGLFLATVHGEFAARWCGVEPEHLRSTGIIDDAFDDHLAGVIPDGYYRTTFQSTEYTRGVVGASLDVVEYIPAGAGHRQDLIVARRREPHPPQLGDITSPTDVQTDLRSVLAPLDVSRSEPLPAAMCPVDRRTFDERWYLDQYPDVARAVDDGMFWSGWQHFVMVGHTEGRAPHPDVDVDWYLRAYPQVRSEVACDDRSLVAEHYSSIGRHRGYLSGGDASRPDNAAALTSRFGGLWFDAGNGHDLIAGKQLLGLLTDGEATSLRHLRDHGFAILHNAVPVAVLDDAERALDACFAGQLPEAHFECAPAGPKPAPWHPVVRDGPAKALDLHWISPEIRTAMFCPELLRFLTVVFERPVLASQSLGFYRGSAQDVHQDSAYVAYSLPHQFVAAWIALEDVTPAAGELVYVPGSHAAFGEFLYPQRTRNLHEAKRNGADPDDISRHIDAHLDEIEHQTERLGMHRQRFTAHRGDILIWHPNLAHGGNPISTESTRKSIVAHYCPGDIAPLFMETQPCEIRQHTPHASYTTSEYP